MLVRKGRSCAETPQVQVRSGGALGVVYSIANGPFEGENELVMVRHKEFGEDVMLQFLLCSL